MNEVILQTLNEIENDHDIKILFACESGSRAWGYAHEASDYDVRFIYIHPPAWYLSIDPKRDFIELPVTDKLDVSGWELQKSLKLYRKSNPTILEWIHSSIVYAQPYNTVEKLRKHTNDIFSPVACIYHYLHMAQKNHRKEKKSITVKNYINILRPLLAASWIEKYRQFPPVDLMALIEKMIASEALKEEMKGFISGRMNGESTVLHNTDVTAFIEEEIQRLGTNVKKIDVALENPAAMLNKIFYDSLKEVWGDIY